MSGGAGGPTFLVRPEVRVDIADYHLPGRDHRRVASERLVIRSGLDDLQISRADATVILERMLGDPPMAMVVACADPNSKTYVGGRFALRPPFRVYRAVADRVWTKQPNGAGNFGDPGWLITHRVSVPFSSESLGPAANPVLINSGGPGLLIEPELITVEVSSTGTVDVISKDRLDWLEDVLDPVPFLMADLPFGIEGRDIVVLSRGKP